jgi:hypothetical protein
MSLKKLRVLVPERHDLALMKVVREDRHDEDMIAEIHAHQPLKLDVLLKRFAEEMGHLTKDRGSCGRSSARWCLDCSARRRARRVPSKRKPGAGGMRVQRGRQLLFGRRIHDVVADDAHVFDVELGRNRRTNSRRSHHPCPCSKRAGMLFSPPPVELDDHGRGSSHCLQKQSSVERDRAARSIHSGLGHATRVCRATASARSLGFVEAPGVEPGSEGALLMSLRACPAIWFSSSG